MAEVGILNLTIKDNSDIAQQNLGKLAGALRDVKSACCGPQLESVANALKKINENINPRTPGVLRSIGSALEKIKAASDFSLPNLQGLKSVMKYMETMQSSASGLAGAQQQAMDGVTGTARTVAEGFENVETRIEEATNEYRDFIETSEAAGKASPAMDFSGFDPGKLPLGALGAELGDATQEMIKFGDISRDAFNTLKENGVFNEIATSIENTASSVQNLDSGLEHMSDVSAEAAAESTRQWQEATSDLQTIMQERAEIMAAEDQRRLESNYQSYRDLFMSGEGNWQQIAQDAYGFTAKAFEEGETYAEALKITMQEINEYVDHFIESLNTPSGPLLRDSIDDAMGIGNAFKSAQESAAVLKNAPEISENLQQVKSETQGMTESFRRSSNATVVLGEDMRDLDKELKQKKSDLKNAGDQAKTLYDRFKDLAAGAGKLGDSFKKMFPSVSGLLSRFKNLVKYRMLRAVLKHIAEGFKEGVENVYYYSKAIGSDFHQKMDDAAASLLQMKNAIGAAVSPAIQALIPILQTVVNWFINLVNIVNQFFALMAGQKTWTRALYATTSAYDDQTKAAKKTGAAVKDLLADWDELNIIQSQGGGGGGTSGKEALDYLKMFEEVGRFDNKIKQIMDFIKDNLNTIKVLAASIGAALLGWKLSKTFTDFLPLLGKIGTGLMTAATVGITLALTDITGKEFLNGGGVGWFIADALTGALGATLAGALATKLAGATAGTVTAGFTLTLAGLVNIKNAVNAQAQIGLAKREMLVLLASAQIGIGAALVTAGFSAGAVVSIATGGISAALALTIGTILAIEAEKAASYKEMAENAFATAGEGGISPQKYLEALQTRFDELTKGSKLVTDIYMEIDSHGQNFKTAVSGLKNLNAVVGGDSALTKDEAQTFKDTWDIVISEFGEISKVSYDTVFAGLNEAIANGSAKIKETSLELRAEAIKLEGIMGGARAALKKDLELLTNAISSGSASKDDMEKYKSIYKTLADETDSGIDILRRALQEGTAAFDFSGEENPVEAAVQFIKTMNEQHLIPAIAQFEEQYNDTVAAVENMRKENDKMYELNYITPEQHEQYKQFFDELVANAEERFKEQKEQATAATEDAMNAIARQAMEGYFSLSGSDEAQLKSYVDNVFAPLVKALEEAGYQIPEEMKAIIARNGKDAVNATVEELAREASRAGIYQSFLDDATIENPEAFAIGYELDLVGQDPTEIGHDAMIEIINAMYETFGSARAENFFELLRNTFGWGFQEMFDALDISNFETEELKDLQDIIDVFNNKHGLDLKMPKVNDESVTQQTNDAAAAYEEMARRIRAAFAMLDGLSFSMDLFGMSSFAGIKVNFPVEARANGGPIKSGDLIMANENGKIEMMGKMGSQPVVANNQQIVDGITSGVSNANDNVVAELRNLLTVTQRILNKKFSAQVVAGSGMGRANQMSADAYGRVTG